MKELRLNFTSGLAVILCLTLMVCLFGCTIKTEDTTGSDTSQEKADSSNADPSEDSEASFNATQVLEIRGFDWGPAVTKTVIHLDKELTEENIDKENFTVKERKQGIGSLTSVERKVLNAYLSDDKGNKTEGNSDHLTLELSYSPDEGSPFRFNMATFMNEWAPAYQLEITLKEGKKLSDTEGNEYLLKVDPETDVQKALFPELENAATDGVFKGSAHELTYASFVPDNASEDHKRPLVIWLHGMGEGGKDPKIAVLGNRVTKLFSEEFQNAMKGCYVLVPQTETYWMQYAENGSWADNKGRDSIYLKDLKELIDQYVSDNYIDPDKIIIGGCSNGGFMTMDMLFNYPEMFAGAYPICEAYASSGITEDMVNNIKDIPMWITYAKNDTTVSPASFEEPLIDMLEKAGAKDLHISVFEDVHDTSGEFKTVSGAAYQYQGHWSWIYFFNNECTGGDLKIWDWMSGLVNG